MICMHCRQTYPFKCQLFDNESITAECSGCWKYPKRTKRGRQTGRKDAALLRPGMVFYDDPGTPGTDLIEEVREFDIQQHVDTFLVAGTSLSRKVRGKRHIVEDFRRKGCENRI